jgi:hypothetical protein
MVTGGPMTRGALVGKQFIVWSGGCRPEFGSVYRFDTRTWSEIAMAPDQLNSVAAAGDRMFGLIGESSASISEFDVQSGKWGTPSPAPEALAHFPRLAWTGTELLVWGGFDAGQVRTGAAFRPTP